MTNKLNNNQISALQSLNQQIISNQIPNTEPYPVKEDTTAYDGTVNANVSTTPKQLHGGLRIHKTDIKGITDIDELHNTVVAHVAEVDFLQYIDDMGGNRNKYIREDKTKIPVGIIAVVVCDYTIKLIDRMGYALCQLSEGDCEIKSAYLFNGKYWLNINDRWIKNLLREILISMGYDPLESKMFGLGMALIQTFWDFVPRTPSKDKNKILINLRNGTLNILANSDIKSQPFNQKDFLMYCLDYDYNPDAKCPLFTKYLDRVLPDKESQKVLQELIGSIFIKNINLEKIGILLGSGANGKSVLLKIITAMLGVQNISQMDLKALTTDRNADNNRSHLLGKLLNFAPEINARGEQAHDLIKRMASSEAITAKLMYKDTFVMTDYAKLIFNANTLPTDVEHTHGFFRRFLIVHFEQTISESEKDPDLANKIIANELPAVLNWVIEGTKRLQSNKQFSYCKKSDEILSEYQLDSDVVALWIDDRCYIPHDVITQTLKDLYNDFVEYASQSGYRKLPIDRTLAKRLRLQGFKERKGKPAAFYIIKGKSNNNTMTE